ncbi:MAG: HsdR family type I site-specific deoxyribonuclease [Flavipsychrobacter sp.]|nr:HsdR family type I site-specific deoxyribonuclease [Flavipsychrobacter sp.]
MSTVGQPERYSQNRIVQLFRQQLQYDYLGNWEDRLDNSNIEVGLLRQYLSSQGYSTTLIGKALDRLKAAANNYERELYDNNKEVYSLLRYGVKVKPEAGELTETVHLINWKQPERNHFAIAEEVTVMGNREKRPDIVLYINGIAIGVLELKRSTGDIGAGIRQSITNQQREFIGQFFSTIQLVMAGNDSEGLRYGTIGTGEKYFLRWKEDEQDASMLQVDKYLLKLCNKQRLLELLYDFVLFDGGKKKLPRYHQYFGIKAAQESVKRREGGIIWHTQGSGKSITMVLLAKWILENNPDARVVLITDREELDKQIKRVFEDAGEQIVRSRSGKDLLQQLSAAKPRLLCSLVHKFGVRDEDDFDAYIKELEASPAKTVGELFVFVDECHRTQSGRLHKVMKAMLKNAVFIGFTGTPLLKKDKQTSLEVFGSYIHTYKFNEAVEDKVVLDLVYEARDIDQRLSSPDRVDEYFEKKTKGLNDFQRSELKRKWGTMQKVLSSKSRMDKIVTDIIYDFSVKPRISDDAGNAILVAGSMYEACRYYELFQSTELRGKCAIITSYNPSYRNVVLEDTGENTETEKQFMERIYESVLTGYHTDTEKYEDWAKNEFIKNPARMKLLIVVAKLLTGFDAPPCTYLYIDKSMQDHGLFQAICRVNRLDGESKDFGYIVDYKNLFDSVKGAIAVYTSELDYDNFKQEDVDVMMQDRLKLGKERLDAAMVALGLLCEPVEPPRSSLDFQHYFCGNPEVQDELKATEFRRTALYKGIVTLIRAYANINGELPEAGYTDAEIADVERQVDFYLKLREEIRKASGETLDLKTYEADMRYLIDKYIQAEDPTTISPFADIPLLDLIVKSGIADAIGSLPGGIKSSKVAIAETIENNVRQKIIKDHLLDPAFYDEMSKLLHTIIEERRAQAIEYEEYLRKIAALVNTVSAGKADDTPAQLRTPALRALYNNLGKNEALAVQIHHTVIEVKPDGWRGVEPKERIIMAALYGILRDVQEVERIFEIVKQQAEY